MNAVRRGKIFFVGTLIVASVAILSLYLLDQVSLTYFREGDYEIDSLQRSAIEIEKPVVLYGMEVNHLQVIEDVVRRDQRFVDMLAGFYVSPKALQQLHAIPQNVFDFRKIVYNRKYVLMVAHDSLHSIRALVYEPGPLDYFVFHFTDTLRVEAGHHPVDLREKEVAGVIGSSLAETISVLGISPELTNRFVDIFAWQIDFQRLQKGDRFKLFYEEQWVNGKSIGIGKILGIYFEHFNHPYFAIPFDQGNGLEYFDSEGNSLRKALLKYPIELDRKSVV